MARIHLIARGVWQAHGQVLLALTPQGPRAFLPGGHVEHGESATAALVRELKEETGLDVRAGPFLGVMEHRFERKTGKMRHEIGLYFRMTGPEDAAGRPIEALEPQGAFAWHPVDRLHEIDLLPYALRTLLPAWLRDAGPPGEAPQTWVSHGF